MSRVFANGPRYRASIPGRVIPTTQKMVLDAAFHVFFIIFRWPNHKKWSV